MWNIEYSLIVGVINLMVGLGLLFPILDNRKKRFKGNYRTTLFWCILNLILAVLNIYLYYIGS